MLLHLTDLSDEPLQSQINRQIRTKILNGELTAGTILPSIRNLAKEQRVSVVTVQRGYESLERDGLIHSRRGKGFFVSPIDETHKKEMAMNRFIEKIEPIVKVALEEGMRADDLVKSIQAICKKEEMQSDESI